MKLAQHVFLRLEPLAFQCSVVAFIETLLLVTILVASVLVERNPVRKRSAGAQDTQSDYSDSKHRSMLSFRMR
jgi:hypothetical protein